MISVSVKKKKISCTRIEFSPYSGCTLYKLSFLLLHVEHLLHEPKLVLPNLNCWISASTWPLWFPFPSFLTFPFFLCCVNRTFLLFVRPGFSSCWFRHVRITSLFHWGSGFWADGVRKPPGPWKVSDLDIVVDPVPQSFPESHPGPGASSGSDGASRECTELHMQRRGNDWTSSLDCSTGSSACFRYFTPINKKEERQLFGLT